jgi:hypothetical protein
MAGFETLVHCSDSSGKGEITGPRSTVSEYRLTGCEAGGEKCKSAGAGEEEITTGPIAADLVYIDQARREVGMLLNPGGGIYIAFACGGIPAKGEGPFLAPVSPIDQEATSFTATLDQFDSVETPDQYEGEHGELLPAVPTGSRESKPLVPTGVELAMAVHTSVPVEVKAVTAQEIREEEATQREETLQKQEEALKKREEALAKTEEHVKQVGEEVAAELVAAAKQRQREEAAARKRREEEQVKSPPSRARLLARALRECRKQPKRRQARCVATAHRKYGRR